MHPRLQLLPSLSRRVMPMMTVIAGFAICSSVLAQSESAAASGVNWMQLNMGLFGGLALFLAGLEVLSDGLKKAAGNTLRDVLAKLTVNRVMGAITGAFVTAILNSSSVTTVLVVGFVTANVMTLAQSVGVIMGANIGSTFTAQILAFNVSAYSLVPVAVGFFMFFSAKADRTRHIGMMIMGLGLVFYGMGLMSDGMRPLRTYQPFLDVLAQMENPLLGILAGALFTGLVQSSAATVGIAIAMASEGLLSLPAGIGLALGANIGTCATALLAALGKPAEAVRAAVVHISFNIVGVLVWLPFLGVLADVAVSISPAGDAPSEAVPRQIANANTMFNVINTVIFIGFTTWFAKLAERLVPDRPTPERVIVKPQFLDRGALGVPSVAHQNARNELARVGRRVLAMFGAIRKTLKTQDKDALAEVAKLSDEVDVLSLEIASYLGRLRKQMLTDADSQTNEALMSALANLRSVAEVVDSEMSRITHQYVEGEFQAPSDQTVEMVQGMWDTVISAVELANQAVGEDHQRAAQDVLLLKNDIAAQADELFLSHADKLRPDDPVYLRRVQLMMMFIEKLRHVYTLTKRMAKTQLPTAVARDAI